MESLKVLNKRLATKYGKVLDGRSNFRLVHSSTEYEKRIADWEEYYGHIFIRQWRGMKEVPKYFYLPEPTWVLERLVFGENHDDMPGIFSTYEPCWSFFDHSKKPVYPVWKYVDYVVQCVLHGIEKTIKRTMQDMYEEDRANFRKEVDFFYEALGGDDNPYGNQRTNFVKPVYLASGDKKWLTSLP